MYHKYPYIYANSGVFSLELVLNFFSCLVMNPKIAICGQYGAVSTHTRAVRLRVDLVQSNVGIMSSSTNEVFTRNTSSVNYKIRFPYSWVYKTMESRFTLHRFFFLS